MSNNDPWGNTSRPEIPWHCLQCEGPGVLEVIERWWIRPEEWHDWEPHERVMTKCTSCGEPYVLGRDANWDNQDQPLMQLWPAVDPPLPQYVPRSIRDSHQEAVLCRRFQAYTGAALLARRGVEAICAEHGYRKGMLAQKLNDLLEDGVIDNRLFEWSSVVRDLGNSGAHDIEAPLTKEDAEDAIAFFEALVNYLYTFQRRYEEHKKRRAPDVSDDGGGGGGGALS